MENYDKMASVKTEVLLASIDGLSASSKFGLICLLGPPCHGRIPGGVRAIAVSTGLNDRAVTCAMQEFERIGILVWDVQPARGRGQRRSVCSIDSAALSALLPPPLIRDVPPHIPGMLDALLASILRARAERQGAGRLAALEQRGGRLDPINALVLAVLLSASDEFGFVRGVGMAQLSALTGLTKVALKSQLGKLQRLGFVRHVISGCIGPGPLKGATTLIILNLQHPLYGASRPAGMLSVWAYPNQNDELQTGAVQPAPERGPAKAALVDSTRDRLGSLWARDGVIGLAAIFARDRHDYPAAPLVQARYEFLASQWLSEAWMDLLSDHYDEQRVQFFVDSDTKTHPDFLKSHLDEKLALLAFKLAKSVQSDLMKITGQYGPFLGLMTHRILPRPIKASAVGYAVLSKPRDFLETGDFNVLFSHEGYVEKFASEDDITGVRHELLGLEAETEGKEKVKMQRHLNNLAMAMLVS